MSTMLAPIAPSSCLNEDELSKATQCLSVTRDRLVETLSGLTDSQWNFKPAPDRWSIAEILEHLVIVENRVHAIVARMPESAPDEPGRVNSEVEELILAEVPKRSAKVSAPPFICPSNQWSPEESLARFLESRANTLKLLGEAPCLRGYVIPHPILGLWDGYQWILGSAAHSARHTGQIREVMACAGFPHTDATPSAPLN